MADEKSVNAEAEKIINGQRQSDYGTPGQSFGRIAKMWSAYLDVEVAPHDVVNMMTLLKVCRAKQGFHRDSYVDIAGYAGCAELLTKEHTAQWLSKDDIPPERYAAGGQITADMSTEDAREVVEAQRRRANNLEAALRRRESSVTADTIAAVRDDDRTMKSDGAW